MPLQFGEGALGKALVNDAFVVVHVEEAVLDQLLSKILEEAERNIVVAIDIRRLKQIIKQAQKDLQTPSLQKPRYQHYMRCTLRCAQGGRDARSCVYLRRRHLQPAAPW